jgi:hypothetical protein
MYVLHSLCLIGRKGEVLVMDMIVLLEDMVAMPVHGPTTATALNMLMGIMVITKGKFHNQEL